MNRFTQIQPSQFQNTYVPIPFQEMMSLNQSYYQAYEETQERSDKYYAWQNEVMQNVIPGGRDQATAKSVMADINGYVDGLSGNDLKDPIVQGKLRNKIRNTVGNQFWGRAQTNAKLFNEYQAMARQLQAQGKFGIAKEMQLNAYNQNFDSMAEGEAGMYRPNISALNPAYAGELAKKFSENFDKYTNITSYGNIGNRGLLTLETDGKVYDSAVKGMAAELLSNQEGIDNYNEYKAQGGKESASQWANRVAKEQLNPYRVKQRERDELFMMDYSAGLKAAAEEAKKKQQYGSLFDASNVALEGVPSLNERLNTAIDNPDEAKNLPFIVSDNAARIQGDKTLSANYTRVKDILNSQETRIKMTNIVNALISAGGDEFKGVDVSKVEEMIDTYNEMLAQGAWSTTIGGMAYTIDVFGKSPLNITDALNSDASEAEKKLFHELMNTIGGPDANRNYLTVKAYSAVGEDIRSIENTIRSEEFLAARKIMREDFQNEKKVARPVSVSRLAFDNIAASPEQRTTFKVAGNQFVRNNLPNSARFYRKPTDKNDAASGTIKDAKGRDNKDYAEMNKDIESAALVGSSLAMNGLVGAPKIELYTVDGDRIEADLTNDGVKGQPVIGYMLKMAENGYYSAVARSGEGSDDAENMKKQYYNIVMGLRFGGTNIFDYARDNYEFVKDIGMTRVNIPQGSTEDAVRVDLHDKGIDHDVLRELVKVGIVSGKVSKQGPPNYWIEAPNWVEALKILETLKKK